MKAWALAVALFVPSAVYADDIRATVSRIVDGDTFEVRGGGLAETIRLCGVDSPEESHTGYKEAADFLRGKIDGRHVRCVRIGEGTVCDGRSPKRSHKRVVAQCFLGSDDVGAMLVRAGLACDYPKHSGGYYQTIGVANVCQSPRVPLFAFSSGGCNIKGNISAKGERIYHVPGQEHYDATVITPSKGEQMFCTEAEARDAGWRKAKR